MFFHFSKAARLDAERRFRNFNLDFNDEMEDGMMTSSEDTVSCLNSNGEEEHRLLSEKGRLEATISVLEADIASLQQRVQKLQEDEKKSLESVDAATKKLGEVNHDMALKNNEVNAAITVCESISAKHKGLLDFQMKADECLQKAMEKLNGASVQVSIFEFLQGLII